MAKRLRIAQVAPVAGPVEPHSQGSIEQLVWLLTEELVRRGHDVTLFAAGDSRTSARLQAVYARGYEQDGSLWNWQFHETLHVAAAFEHAAEFDVIHSHVYHTALPFTRLVQTPVVHTYHILPDPDIVQAYERYPEAHIVAISDYQRSLLSGPSNVGVVHHGIETDAFPFVPTRGAYLLFLGRILPDKGVVEAIRLAEGAGWPLIIAGPRNDEEYFLAEVAPRIERQRVVYVGPVGREQRNTLLAGAAALVYPIRAPEPFGLVLVEAMACGTPVAAVGLGAVPEIVEQGVTGYYSTDVDALAAVVPAVLELNRARVRGAAVARFDYRHMVDGYEAVYARLASRGTGARQQMALTGRA